MSAHPLKPIARSTTTQQCGCAGGCGPNTRSGDAEAGLIVLSSFTVSFSFPMISRRWSSAGWSDVAGWALHLLESAALSRRTPKPAISLEPVAGLAAAQLCRLFRNRLQYGHAPAAPPG